MHSDEVEEMAMRVLACVLACGGAGAETAAKKPISAKDAERGEDAKLRAIYDAEWQWRLKLREEDEEQPHQVRAKLPQVDAATQRAKLEHWQGMMKQLDGVRVRGSTSGRSMMRCWRSI